MINEFISKIFKTCCTQEFKNLSCNCIFYESSFFPIPPDVMIVPMVIAKKNDYLKIFLIATLFSTLGGVLGILLVHIFLILE